MDPMEARLAALKYVQEKHPALTIDEHIRRAAKYERYLLKGEVPQPDLNDPKAKHLGMMEVGTGRGIFGGAGR